MRHDEHTPPVREAEAVSGGITAPATVLILAGDPIVGRTLQLLIRTTDYDARYVSGVTPKQLRALDSVRVLLLAPQWDAAGRRLAAEVRDRVPDPQRVAILEIGAPPQGVSLDPQRHVPWPCRREELMRRIDAALTHEPASDGAVRRGGGL